MCLSSFPLVLPFLSYRPRHRCGKTLYCLQPGRNTTMATCLVWPSFRFGKLNDTGWFGFPARRWSRTADAEAIMITNAHVDIGKPLLINNCECTHGYRKNSALMIKQKPDFKCGHGLTNWSGRPGHETRGTCRRNGQEEWCVPPMAICQ